MLAQLYHHNTHQYVTSNFASNVVSCDDSVANSETQL